jgi:AraC-like DNA-binding protein
MQKKNLFSYLQSLFSKKKSAKAYSLRLSSDDIEMVKNRLADLMEHEKPYLRKGYHISNLAEDLGIPTHLLSAFINQVFGIHFSDYMNKKRISHCLELIQTDRSGKPDLNELSQKCGFNNRNSFTAAFRKFTGRKPFEYIKEKNQRNKNPLNPD